jgi:hypothetical protein
MRENFFSAAVLVANMGQPGFDGNIKYSSQIDSDPISGFGKFCHCCVWMLT